ncbi:MAG: LysR family transcriptional regulator ArgP [Paracoccaceae bacterium]
MFDYPQLAALAAVHRRGAFDLAAADLGVTPSAVSQRIKALEERTGTLLIIRGQPCTATATGLRLIAHLDQVALLETSLHADLPRLDHGPTPLRIAVNADSLATWVIPALAATTGFLFDLVIADQDIAQDWLRKGEVVAAITSAPGPLQGCETISLGALRYRATAAPAFVATWFPDGLTAAALTRAPALQFSENDRLQSQWAARETGFTRPLPAHRIASSEGFVAACAAGLAWALNPEGLIATHLANRTLIDLRPSAPLDVPLYWQFSRLTAAAIAPLTAAIRRAARTQLH